MKQTLKVTVGALAGLAVAFVLVFAVELYSMAVHPLPTEFDHSTEQMCAHVAAYPNWVLATVIPLWSAIGWTAAWTSRQIGAVIAASLVGILIIAAVAFNVAMLPYPAWFKIGCLLAIPAAVLHATRPCLARRA